MACRMNSRLNDSSKEDDMAQYAGLQSVLNAVLGEYRSMGFRLIEDGDHFLELYYQDGLLDVYNQARTPIIVIQNACKTYLRVLGAS